MKSINRVTLLGNLTKDPELKYTQTGTAICRLSVATNRSYKDDSGQWQDKATYHNLTAWADRGERLANSMKLGDGIYVEGHIENRSWKAQDGTTRYATDIIVDDYKSFPKAAKAQGTDDFSDVPEDLGESEEKAEKPKSDAGSDDIPF